MIVQLIITKTAGTEIDSLNAYGSPHKASWEETFEVFPRMLIVAAIFTLFNEFIALKYFEKNNKN